MRSVFLIVIIVAFLGSAFAFELGNQPRIEKDNSHVGQNPGTPDGREGGEDMENAVPILELPYTDYGVTTYRNDDYDAVCPYSGSTSPDVVYSYQPLNDEVISVDLCGSGYDTKTYIFEGSGDLVFCNDDFYFDESCGHYVSLIEEAYLTAGEFYYIIIDGYGGDGGPYNLRVAEAVPPVPCSLECSGWNEDEPPLGPGYEDAFNGGCNSPQFGEPFQYLESDWNGELTFCGTSGWYASNRDTDWFMAFIGEMGLVEWTLDAEQESFGFVLAPHDCNNVAVDQQMTAGPCLPANLVIQGNPGDMLWLWVGPTEYNAPPGFSGYEYNYISAFTGLETAVINTESFSFDRLKSLFR